tara:strand:- start:4254 stop:4667 length:414 start_codon:yes stop_codon:yes gene_type:complete
MIGRLTEKIGDYLYFLFRILVGLMFATHGMQKLFGMFGGAAGDGVAVPLVSLMGLAGTIELVGGLLIALGLITRLAALITSLEMLIAYFMAHASNGLVPLVNRGELALLYFAAFLVVLIYGAKKWGLDLAIFKRELL